MKRYRVGVSRRLVSAAIAATAVVLSVGVVVIDTPVVSIGSMLFYAAIVLWLARQLQVGRRRSQAQLIAGRVSEDRFARTFEASPLPSVLVRSGDNQIVEVNEAAVACIGRSRAELIGSKFDAIGIYVATPVSGAEARVRTIAGEIDAACWIETFDIDDIAHELHIVEDITQRKRAEAALKESESRFREVTSAIHEVFWLTDPSRHEILFISPAYEAIWGRSCAGLLANPSDWLEAIHSDDRARVLDAVETRQQTGAYDERYRIVRPDGSIRTIRDRAFVLRDPDGRVIRIAGLAEDITEHVALEDQLRQAQKLESLGLLAGGVAHDFNNLLSVIMSCSSLLVDAIPADHPDHQLVDDIDHAVHRATGLTRQLLAFSRRQVVEPQVLDLNACVNETRKMLRRMVGEDVVLTTSLEPELLHVCADPGYLVQVIMNLAVNARDAMPRGGMLELATRNVILDEAQARSHPGAKPGEYVVLCVKDTGCGMTPEVRARVFEPFFTTKPVGHGTGMGLAVVRGIIDQAGGHVVLTSAPNEGTTFEIYLPATHAPQDQRSADAAHAAVGIETLLLVDDDDYVRRAAARALRARGYTVLEAPTGAAALELVDQQPNVSMLLTDVVMPGMDGRQLAEAVHDRRPAIKVLYISGYADDAVVRHGVMVGEVELLEKPFHLDALATRVRRILDRAPLPQELS